MTNETPMTTPTPDTRKKPCRYQGCGRLFVSVPARNVHEGKAHGGVWGTRDWDDLSIEERVDLLRRAIEQYLGHPMGYRKPVDQRALDRRITR